MGLKAPALMLTARDWRQADQDAPIDLRVEKPAVLIFFSSFCPCSKAHEPVVDGLRLEFEKKGLAFIGIVSGRDEERHLFMSQTKWKGQILRDEGGGMAKRYLVQKTPHVLLLNSVGSILYSGGIDDASDPQRAKSLYLKDALTQFLAGKKIAQKHQRVLGCYLR
jgi:hypothetical protein